MSFLTRTIPTTTRLLPATSRVCFSTGPAVRKSVVDTVKNAAKAVDRTVSDGLVKGIETGETMADKTKSAVGVNKAKAQGKASELAGEAKGKAAELKGQAKEKASSPRD